MAKLVWGAIGNKGYGLFAVISLLLIATSAQAAVEKMTTYKDEQGWKLQRDGEDFYIKGVVWGYSPRGANYTYNLWNESDEFIEKVLDHDFGLMARAGVTANRSFTLIPPEWVTYIYEKHGVMSIINPLMGRYGATIDGVWRPLTNYSDERTRATLKAESLAVVEQYKDVKGVAMFAFGNESNYGLSWSSFEIEDLPVGEQNREKAKSLYSLWGEVVRESKQMAPDHLFTIVNGDIQYLDLIVEYVEEMDVLGTNVYRGISFGELWKDVKEGFDRPVVFMEFGSDAFNAKNFAEDQAAQASFLRGQWQEIYHQSYGNGGYGNAVGGFVFEWRDEWWKYKQTENLDVQDRNASWSNGGYTFDYVEGQNNMNEEWFGIMALGDIDNDGIYTAEARMAYDVMSEIWAMDPYSGGKAAVNTMINDVDMELIALKSDIRELKSSKKLNDKFRLSGGSFDGIFLVKGRQNDLDEAGENGLVFSDGQMLFLDFEFQPTDRIQGDFSLNILGNSVESDFQQRYGDRGLPYTVEVVETTSVSPDQSGTVAIKRTQTEVTDNERIEIYDFQASYTDNNYDLLAFYHTPRYHWGDEGDFYGLLRETTDMEGQDIWNSKAPYGLEFAGKEEIDGLKVVAGPEVYWGANPKAIIKYEFGANKQYAFIHSEDIAERDTSSSATEATSRQSRQTTFYARRKFGSSALELGGIMSATEKVDDTYDRLEGDDIVVDEIEFEDTLGIKGRYSFDVGSSSRAYLGFNYAGLVADGGEDHSEWGTELPYASMGNKQEIEGGLRFTDGDYTWYPRFLYRENLVDANPLIPPETGGTNLDPGLSPRDTDSDPFAVLDNREATSGELIFTYDPTPATWFYHWNADLMEDAAFAYNIGLTATRYGSDTDAYLFFFEEGGTNASFGEGLDSEDVWLLKSKMIFNPRRGLKTIFNAYAGAKQSSGQPGQETVEFFSFDTKIVVDKTHIYSAIVRVDDFGPYDFQEQFNIVYPLQLELEYTRLLDQLRDEQRSSQIGVVLFYRTLDELSPADEYENGENDYMFELQTYFKVAF
jgi:beta-galactosidase